MLLHVGLYSIAVCVCVCVCALVPYAIPLSLLRPTPAECKRVSVCVSVGVQPIWIITHEAAANTEHLDGHVPLPLDQPTRYRTIARFEAVTTPHQVIGKRVDCDSNSKGPRRRMGRLR